jgi:hypothetical protein
MESQCKAYVLFSNSCQSLATDLSHIGSVHNDATRATTALAAVALTRVVAAGG